jgi:xylulokinase
MGGTSVSERSEHTIGLDVGTTGVKGLLVAADGRVVAGAAREYPLLTPQPGWTEQEPVDWWRAAVEVLRELAGRADGSIAALGLTGQMHGSVFLDADGRPIRPALLWNDQRTADECADIEQRVGSARLRELTGNPALTGFQAPKILWLRRHEPEAYGRVRHVLLPKDYVCHELTGTFATDASDAAGTLLLDLRRRDWSSEVLDALDIPAVWLPEVFEGPEVTGHLAEAVAHGLGLPAGLPVVAGGGDNAAAAVGCGVIREGTGFVSLGTSGVVFAHSDAPRIDPDGALHAFCHAVPGAYHLMGVVLSAGGALRWHRDTVAPGTDYARLVDEAAHVPPGADGLTFLPYLAGERTPHMDPDARAAWIGLSLAHERRHMTRAVLEGVAFALADSVERMRALGVELDTLYAVGGGARSDAWRAIVAAAARVRLQRLAAEEGPAMGAAILAMVGAGLYPDVAAAVTATVRPVGEPQAPDPDLVDAYRGPYARYRALFPALRSIGD